MGDNLALTALVGRVGDSLALKAVWCREGRRNVKQFSTDSMRGGQFSTDSKVRGLQRGKQFSIKCWGSRIQFSSNSRLRGMGNSLALTAGWEEWETV